MKTQGINIRTDKNILFLLTLNSVIDKIVYVFLEERSCIINYANIE